MKKIAFVLIVIFVFVLTLCSCDIVSNSITTAKLNLVEKDGETYFESLYSKYYKIDLSENTFSLSEENFDFDDEMKLKLYNFAGEYEITVPKGYEGVVTHLEKCELDNDSSVVDATGYLDGEKLIGFVQVYKEMTGVHGNYAVEKIDHSLVFSYDAKSDSFEIIKRFDGVVVVAYCGDKVIYWENREYYVYDMKIDEKEYLVEDLGYDSGMSQQSSSAVISNKDTCIFHFVKDDTEYMYVYDFSANELIQMNYKK